MKRNDGLAVTPSFLPSSSEEGGLVQNFIFLLVLRNPKTTFNGHNLGHRFCQPGQVAECAAPVHRRAGAQSRGCQRVGVNHSARTSDWDAPSH